MYDPESINFKMLQVDRDLDKEEQMGSKEDVMKIWKKTKSIFKSDGGDDATSFRR